MERDLRQLDRKNAYKLLIGVVVPRPIAFVTSQSPSGVVNAAPFSFYTAVAADPPMLVVSVNRRNGVMKDTARNIVATGEFVVNAVDRDLVEAANACSADFPPDVSEVEIVGLTTVPSRSVRVPGLAEAKIRMECRLVQHIPLGRGPATDVIVGEVVHIFIRDDLYCDGKIDLEAYRPVARLAGTAYCEVGPTFSLPRPGG